tara:strand:+ start:1561 stop:2868 length:1308 start_codon:yes stop_codon:yes gene_type:complete
MFENYDLIKNFINSKIKKKRALLHKILITNTKKNFFLYTYNMDFYFESIKRPRQKLKITDQKNFYEYLRKFFYCLIALIKAKKNTKFKYFLFYSVSNQHIKNKFTNIFKEALFKKINKKLIFTKYLIYDVPINMRSFTYEYPVNFIFLYLYFKSIIKYFFLSKKYKSRKTKRIIINTLYKYEQYKYWKKFLKKKLPRSIFLIDKISNFPLVQAANELKINTYELQHGSPLTKKNIDSYKMKINGKFFNIQSWFSSNKPDYYLCSGEFWKKNTDKNNYSKNIINIGLNINYLNIPKKKKFGILILSELTEFDEIENIINKLNKYNVKKNLIKIRFHPAISKLPDDIEFFLKNNKIKYSFAKFTNINKDLKDVNRVIGLNSTLLFYLYERGYQTYFFDTKLFPKNYLIKDKSFFNLSYLNKRYKKKFFSSNKNKIPF